MSNESAVNEKPIGFGPWSVLVLAVFFILGPLIGGLSLVGLSPFSFVFGGLQALFVGLAASLFQAMSPTGIISYRPVFFSCLIAAGVSVVLAFALGWRPLDALSFFLIPFIYCGVLVGSGMICCLICNAMRRAVYKTATSTRQNTHT